MSFSLRRQLLVIGLITLALPWFSILYIRETESALRVAQADFLADLGRGLAPLIEPQVDAISSDEDRRYVYPLDRTPVLDGYVDDWALDVRATPAALGGDRLMSLIGAIHGTLWLYTEIRDPDLTRPLLDIACVDDAEQWRLFRIAPEAPGAFSATASNDPDARLLGNWQPGVDRDHLEWRMNAELCTQRLGIAATLTDGEARSYRASAPNPLVRERGALNEALAANSIPGVQTYLVDRDGWRLSAVVGEREALSEADNDQQRTATLYRRIIGDRLPGVRIDDRDPRAVPALLHAALQGGSRQFRATENGEAITVAVQPLGDGRGALVLRQNSAAILTLNNPSLLRLSNRILVATAAVVLALLLWATWTSWRVRRLAGAAERALDARGQLSDALPGSGARDEIGELARNFQTLLGRVGEQQQWLKTMADKLSHELRTPIAVVQSSLDNLPYSGSEDERETLRQRASDGVARLRQILNAMSNANRAEQAARQADRQRFDVSALLEQLCQAYTQAFPGQHFVTAITPGIKIDGSPELLVQALDKLVENAVSFSSDGESIEIALGLAATEQHVEISVFNVGPPLPAGDTRALFESFSTLREDNADGQHLGFGLYIARLIVEAHGGAIAASDETRSARSGACFSITLPIG